MLEDLKTIISIKYMIQSKQRLLPWKAQLSPWQAFVSSFLQEMDFHFIVSKKGVKRSLMAAAEVIHSTAKHS